MSRTQKAETRARHLRTQGHKVRVIQAQVYIWVQNAPYPGWYPVGEVLL